MISRTHEIRLSKDNLPRDSIVPAARVRAIWLSATPALPSPSTSKHQQEMASDCLTLTGPASDTKISKTTDNRPLGPKSIPDTRKRGAGSGAESPERHKRVRADSAPQLVEAHKSPFEPGLWRFGSLELEFLDFRLRQIEMQRIWDEENLEEEEEEEAEYETDDYDEDDGHDRYIEDGRSCSKEYYEEEDSDGGYEDGYDEGSYEEDYEGRIPGSVEDVWQQFLADGGKIEGVC